MILRGQQEHAENMEEEEEEKQRGNWMMTTIEYKASARAEQSAGMVS